MSFYKAYVVAIGSLLTGAAVVHNVYKPDLVTHRPLLLSFCMQTLLRTPLFDCANAAWPFSAVVSQYESQQ